MIKLALFLFLIANLSLAKNLIVINNNEHHITEFSKSSPTDSLNLFYKKIYKNLLIDTSNDQESNKFISFSKESIPISNNYFDFSDSSNNFDKNLIQYSKFVDIIPNITGPYIQPISLPQTTLSNTFSTILNNATFSFTPETPLTNQQKIHLKNIFDDLKDIYPNGTINDSDVVKKCLAYKNVMNVMLSNYRSYEMFIESADATEQDMLLFENITQIYNDINQYNANKYQIYCYEFNSDMEFIENYTGFASEDYLKFIKESMKGSSRLDTTFSEYFNTTYYPAYFYPEIYFKFNFESIDLFTTFVFNYTNDIDFPNIDTNLIGSTNDVNFSEFILNNGNEQVLIDQSNMEIRFEITSLPIDRPWFDEKVLTSNNWQLNEQGYYSTGNNLEGVMPLYISEVLVIRNLNITLNTINNQLNQDAIKKLITSTYNGYFGSLFIKGLVNGIPQNETTPILINENIIHYPGYQIIGFVCNTLPMVPNYNKPSPTPSTPSPTPSTPSPTPSITPTPSQTPSSTPANEKSSSTKLSIFLNINLIVITLLFIIL